MGEPVRVRALAFQILELLLKPGVQVVRFYCTEQLRFLGGATISSSGTEAAAGAGVGMAPLLGTVANSWACPQSRLQPRCD